MNKFWIRQAELIIGGKSYHSDNFEIDFKVDFDDDDEPNVSEVKIYNLAENSLNNINKGSPIILNAGYKGDVGTILQGTVDKSLTTIEGVDKLTTITVGEGTSNWLNSHVNKTYAPGSSSSFIINDLVGMFGMEIGQISLATNKVYPRGRNISGMVQSIMREIAKETESKLHITKNKIYIRPHGTGDNIGFLLNADTGLIESPEPFEEEKEEGNKKKTISGYKVKMLLNHRVTTDSILQIESKTANGTFMVRKGSHSGDFITEVEVV